MILGIDVSVWNGEINWSTALQAGVQFAFLKASQANFSDKLFTTNWGPAGGAGIVRGAYHYYDWMATPEVQASRFLATVGGDPGELPAVLDYEELAGIPPTVQALAAIRRWLELVEAAQGRRPIIYTSLGMWNAHGNVYDPYWARYPLWIADYTPPVYFPDPWDVYAFWQYASSGNGSTYGATGGTMDLDRYEGTMEELRRQFSIPSPGKPGALSMTVIVDALNVRSGPGIGYTKVGSLILGMQVMVSGLRFDAGGWWAQIGAGRWCAMEYGGQQYLV